MNTLLRTKGQLLGHEWQLHEAMINQEDAAVVGPAVSIYELNVADSTLSYLFPLLRHLQAMSTTREQ